MRALRLTVGLTQAELAAQAQVSRALVASLERGLHMPAADAAIRLAHALGSSVERLFAPQAADGALAVLGGGLPDGALVRASRVEDALVARVIDPASALTSTGAPADGMLVDGELQLFSGAAARGAVIAGCDPLLGVAEGLLERAGAARIVGVPATSGQALAALDAGRCHGALVHGPRGSLALPPGLRRWHLARWRSGVASHPVLARPSLETLLGDEVALIERDAGAACQQALERASRRVDITRPSTLRIAAGHLDAARAALAYRGAAVAIEPVAVAMGLDFSELELHDVQLWVPDRWTDSPGVRALLDLLTSSGFHDRAGVLPAYDLSDTGAAL